MQERNTKPILIVDDEPDIRLLISEVLQQAGYPCASVSDGEAMYQAMAEKNYSLLILDLRLQKEDGLMLARSVREKSNIPILMLTGKGTEADRIISLELAADDFLMKPFNIRELVARVNALLRRALMSKETQQSGQQDHHECLAFGNWTLDLTARELSDSNGESVSLTYGEFTLLESLAKKPKRVMSREHLLACLRGDGSNVFDRTIDVLISRLRQKLEINPHAPRYIRTERGIGYSFSEPVTQFHL